MVDRVLLVADQLADVHRAPGVRHPGGAELTDAAAAAACPWKLTPRRFAELDLAELHRHDVIVLGNSARATRAQLDAIARTGRHVSFEHDVRICRWRGNFPASRDPAHALRQRCWCPHSALAELYARARGVLFLTGRQERVFLGNPFFRATRRAVLGSSLFSGGTLERLERLGKAGTERSGALYLWAPDRIKGTELATRYCEDVGLSGTTIRDKTPEEVLELMGRGKTFVCLPLGLEPAGRMPAEARLAGCEVIVNPNVGVSGEPWWQHPREQALEHLAEAPKRFWRLIEGFLSSLPEPAFPRPAAAAVRSAELLLEVAARSSAVVPHLPVAPEVQRRALDIESYSAW